MINLLIIEDEWLTASFIADVAIDQGFYICGIAKNAREAKELLQTAVIDAAIVDINIEGMESGIDTAYLLKEKKIDFLFLTAYKDTDTIIEATNLKPLFYLIKPATREDIIAALHIIKGNHFHKNSSKRLKINTDGAVLLDDHILSLSTYEKTVLTLLIKNCHAIVSHTSFYQSLWDDPNEINSGTLRNIILKLRKRYDFEISNIKNEGYCLQYC